MAKGGYIGVMPDFTPVQLPSGYTQVEYIESTGTQYIDTGIIPTNNTKFEMDFQLTDITPSNVAVFGVVGQFSLRWLGGSNNYFRSVVSGTVNFPTTVSGSDRHFVTFTKTYATIDDTTVNTSPTAISYPVFIFGFNSSGTASAFSSCKCWSFKHYELDVLMHNFIPCKNSSGKAGFYDLITNVFFGNAGTGEFVAGPGYESVARKIKKGYVGVDNISRKIKKAYMGVGGVARPCWGNGISYYGTIAPLSVARYLLASAPVSQYLLFAGGYDDNRELTSALDIYSDNLIKLSSGDLPITVAEMCGSYNENYALFGGGNTPSAIPGSYTVYAYDGQLSRTTAPDLTLRVQGAVGCNLGEYALIAAGSYRVKVFAVNAYNNNLVKSRPSDLSAGGQQLGAAASNSYAIFVGNSSYSDGNLAEAYSSNLVKTNISPLSIKRAGPAGAVVGNYYLFAGGETNTSSTALDTPTDSVEVYNNNLVRQTPVLMSSASCRMAHTEINGFAIFAGGGRKLKDTYPTYDNVEIFDDNLQRTNLKLSKSRTDLSGGTVGKYALFSGGCYKDSSENLVTVNTVDTYIS